jgi:Domain of unknown function (DUF4276)
VKRLYLTVEGQTEAAFAVEVLQPHLTAFEVYMWRPRFTGPHGRRGGRIPQGGMLNTFAHVIADIRRWLREDSSLDARFSMMVDLYSLPVDFPGYVDAQAIPDPIARAARLEQELSKLLDDGRFIPYLQVHEFEALILSRPRAIGAIYDTPATAISNLEAECAAFESPEHIDQGQHTHPKARIKSCFPGYEQTVAGPLLAGDIGLAHLRIACRHFGEWLSRLENLDS